MKPSNRPARAKAATKPKRSTEATKRQVVGGAAPMTQPSSDILAVGAKHQLSDTEVLFLAQYLVDRNGSAAYRRVKPSSGEPSARVQAARLLAKANVSAALAELTATRLERLEIDADRVVRQAYSVVIADGRELVEYHRTCCRRCYGTGFGYQRTAWEMAHDRAEHTHKEAEREATATLKGQGFVAKPFDEQGGEGFDGRKPPNADCQGCWGRGVGCVVVKDTRQLSEQGLAIYAGVKESKDGLEVKMHSKGDFSERMFKHLGLFEADNSQRDAGPAMTREELDALYRAAQQYAAADKVAMEARGKSLEQEDHRERTGAVTR